MSIDRETVKKLSKLSMLKFEENEMDEIALKLGKILDFVSQLQEVDTDGVEPMTSTLGTTSTAEREDKVVQDESRDAYLSGAPNSEMGFYVVPRVVE